MDRAARNLLALAAIVLTLAAYGLCGFIAYGVKPMFDGRTGDDGLGPLAVIGLGVLLATSIYRGGGTFRRRAAATRDLSRRLGTAQPPPTTPLLDAARGAGLAGRVTLLDSNECCCFVYGMVAPRVAISSGLLARLSPDELRATLEHERYHVEGLDPLRSALADAAVDAMFFLPALGTLRARYEAARELAADRRAIDASGTRPLAGALLKAVEGGAIEHPATISLAASQTIDSRLTQLETGRAPRPAGWERRKLAASALGAGAFLVLLAAAPPAAGGSADVSRELGPASLLEGAILCLLPLALTVTLLFGRLRTHSARGLGPRDAAT
jgi:Zn-dependent protease with chaperone function